MKRSLFVLFASILFVLGGMAQNSSAFQFLRLPVSAHAAALGGDNVSADDDDPMLAFHNPALLIGMAPGTLGLQYMSYMAGSNLAGVSYNLTPTDRSALAFGAEYLGFGTMRRTDVEGTDTGTFTAKDMALAATYSYALSDTWSGGVTGRFIYSNYDVVYSLALGVDLGVNYLSPDADFSFSLVARQLGGQVKTYDGTHESLPFNLVAGFSKSLTHAPVRFSLTLPNLTRWRAADFYRTDALSTKDLLLRHLIVGVDVFPTETTWLALGYNGQLSRELASTSGTRSLAGFTLGAGINVSRIKVGIAYGRYNVASNSLSMNFSYTL